MLNKFKILLSSLLLMTFNNVFADPYPNETMLKDLEQYVNVKKDCDKLSCNSINNMQLLDVDYIKNELKLKLFVNARVLSLFELPFNPSEVQIKDVTLNKKNWYGVINNNNNKFYVSVPEGLNELNFKLAFKANSNVISLSYNPKNFQNLDTSGFSEVSKRNNAYFLELKTNNKLAPNESNGIEKESTNLLPKTPFFTITRNLVLSDKWRMKTTISPLDGVEISKSVKLDIPLIKGENILTEGINVEDGIAHVVLNNNKLEWDSLINETPQMEIKSPNNDFSIYKWLVSSEKDWLFTSKGTNPTSLKETQYEWLLWPEDTVTLSFEKPQILKGENLNIEKLAIRAQYNNKPFLFVGTFTINSSLGGRTYMEIPKEYKLKSLSINERVVPVDDDKKVALDLAGGVNLVKFELTTPNVWSIVSKFPDIKLEKNIVNNNFSLEVSATDRWILFAGGENINPSILLWSVLGTLIIFSFALKYLPTPLTMVAWILLLFGLSQNSLLSVGWVIVAFILVYLKTYLFKEEKEIVNKWGYNFYQALLIVAVFGSVIIFLGTLNDGLLNNPNIFTHHYLEWFSEQSNSKAGAWFISLPLWFYHLIMFFWAGWLAFNVIKWAKWFWNIFAAHSIWISEGSIIEKIKELDE